jgi:hypothetical protein
MKVTAVTFQPVTPSSKKPGQNVAKPPSAKNPLSAKLGFGNPNFCKNRAKQ